MHFLSFVLCSPYLQTANICIYIYCDGDGTNETQQNPYVHILLSVFFFFCSFFFLSVCNFDSISAAHERAADYDYSNKAKRRFMNPNKYYLSSLLFVVVIDVHFSSANRDYPCDVFPYTPMII